MRLNGPAQRVEQTWIGDGDPAAHATLRVMRQLADAAAAEYAVRQWAEALTRECASYDDGCCIHRLYMFVHSRVRYRLDPRSVELVKAPAATLREIGDHGVSAGDCDDQAVLLAALLQSLGYAVSFLGVSEREDGELHHVLLQVQVGSRWITLDPIVPGGVFTGIGGRLNATRVVTA